MNLMSDNHLKWLIVGISGVTCGGKTTLAKEIIELLPGTKKISQDDYFLPEDSEKHILTDLNHFNWEILSALNMEKMLTDIQEITNHNLISVNIKKILKEFDLKHKELVKKNGTICKNTIHAIQNKLLKHNIRILLIEGFCIYNYPPIDEMCHLKFFLTLPYEICRERRSERTYIPADVPGYFDKYVWPEYLSYFEKVTTNCQNILILPEEVKKKTPQVFQYLAFLFDKLP